MKIADVYVNLPLYKSFSYIVKGEEFLYRRVKIPFGRRKLNGFVFRLKEKEEKTDNYKEIEEVLDKKAFIDEKYALFLDKISEDLLFPKGKVFFLSLPPFYDFVEEPLSFDLLEIPKRPLLKVGTFDFKLVEKEIERDLKEGKEPFLVFSDYSVQDYFLENFEKQKKYHTLDFREGKGKKKWEKYYRGDGDIVSGILYPLFLPKRRRTVVYLIDEGPQRFYLNYPFPMDLRDIAISLYRKKVVEIKIFSFSPSLKIFDFIKKEKGEIVSIEKKRGKIYLAPIKRNTFSKEIRDKTAENLEKKRILFLINRSAKDKFLYCPKCKIVATCSKDGAILFFDEKEQKAVCPVCRKKYAFPMKCPVCGTKYVVIGGVGLSSVEKSLKKAFPDKDVLVFSRKSISKSKKEKKLIKDFVEGSYDFLIGTEAVVKPFFIKNLSLIVYFFPELDLGFENPEITEKIFYNLKILNSMLSDDGEMIIKSKNPDFYAIEEFLKGDFRSFLEKEESIRKKLKYFPFTNLVVIRVVSKNRETSLKKIRKFKKLLDNSKGEEEIFGPFYKRFSGGFSSFYLVIRGEELSPIVKNISSHLFPVADTSVSFFINRFS